MAYGVVWFKRDLRLHDHAALNQALAAGPVLDELFALAPFASLHAHEETGNAATYARDRAVARWCRQHQVPDGWLFEPWCMPESVQPACGVRVSLDFP